MATGFRSSRVEMGTKDYRDAKALAERHAASQGGRVEWRDDYNDTSATGVWVVRRRD